MKVKMGTNCYPTGRGWLITLRLKIKNETEQLIRYDFTDALMFMDSTVQIHPDSIGVGRRLHFDYIGAMIDTTEERAALTAESYWKTVPAGDELLFDVPFYLEAWSQDTTQQQVHIRPGCLTDVGGASLCNLPAFYGDPNNRFWTPFH